MKNPFSFPNIFLNIFLRKKINPMALVLRQYAIMFLTKVYKCTPPPRPFIGIMLYRLRQCSVVMLILSVGRAFHRCGSRECPTFRAHHSVHNIVSRLTEYFDMHNIYVCVCVQTSGNGRKTAVYTYPKF